MKRNIAISLLALSTLGTAVAALAQGLDVKATVPFEFTVGDKMLPAGDYTITSSPSGIIHVQNFARHVYAVTATVQGNDGSHDGSKLVFYKYGERYFLHQVLCPTLPELNVDVPASKREKTAQRQEAKLGSREQVLLAAR